MASFWENFAEAMGWSKANHISHLSDIPEEKKQQWRDNYVENAKKNYDKENNPRLKIKNAKDSGDYWTGNGKDFNSDFDNDENYETRVYEFEYLTPNNAENMDANSYDKEYKKGRALVRVPKRESYNGLWPGVETFDDSDSNDPAGTMGVYGAILEDGQQLSADDFDDLLRANAYAGGKSSVRKWKRLKDSDVGKTSQDKVSNWKKYVDSFTDSPNSWYNQSGKHVVWDKKYRGWRSK